MRSLIFLILFSVSGLTSLSQTYNFRNYSVEHGLPFIQVYTIFQDSKGNLWSGGYGGLSKFDGKKFTNYSPKDGLANHWVTSIAEDPEGNLWIGTIKGLSKFNGKKFITYSVGSGLPDEHIHCLFLGSLGNLWIGTSKGLTRYRKGVFKTYTETDGLINNSINKILEDRSGDLWIGTEKGISKLNKQRNTFSSFSLKSCANAGSVNYIYEDRPGSIWFSTGSLLCNYYKGDLKSYSVNSFSPGAGITCIAEDAFSSLWIGTTKGLYKFTGNSFDRYLIKKEANSNQIGCLFRDYENNLWIGTHSGLYRYRSNDFITYNEKDGLANNFIFQTYRDSSGYLWVCTMGGGLYKFREGEGFRPFTTLNGLPSNNTYSLAKDKKSNLWIGTDKGLSKYSKGEFENFDARAGILSPLIYALHYSKKNVLWIAGHGGVTEWDGKRFKAHKFSGDNEFGDVTSIHEDSKGNIWFGSYQGGLVKYNGREFSDVRNSLGLEGDMFMSITEDAEGNLYFGTFDGVFMYDGKKLHNFSEHDGLSSDLVYTLIFEKENEKDLWVGTNQGINKIDIEEYKRSGIKRITPYGKEEGFTGVECNSNGVYRDVDGSIWFGTVNGLIRYNPSEYLPNNKEARLNFTNMKLFYKDTLLEQNIKLPYDQNNISFEYTGISLTNPDKVQYRYMLEGFDNRWSPAVKNNFATFSNIPPGRYTFKVRCTNNEGMWTANPLRFSFTVLAPFWKTLWFRILTVAAIIASVIIGLKLRIRQIKRRERKKTELEVKLATNELKALRAQMNPHFIFNSLNSIQHFILSNDSVLATKYLNKFAKLIRMILHNSEKPTVSIAEELAAIRLYLELEAVRFENKFDYTIEVDEKIDVENFEIPTMLIQPYIENAIIHGLNPKQGKGKLQISLALAPKHIVCTITDTGIGRKASALQKEGILNEHRSLGMKITQERLETLNILHRSDLSVNITDMEEAGKPAGTKVEIYIPLV